MIRDLLAAYDDATHARVEAALREDPPFDKERDASEKFTHPVFKAEGATRDAIISAFEELQAKVPPKPLNARDYLIHLTGRVAMDAEDVARVWEIARGLGEDSREPRVERIFPDGPYEFVKEEDWKRCPPVGYSITRLSKGDRFYIRYEGGKLRGPLEVVDTGDEGLDHPYVDYKEVE